MRSKFHIFLSVLVPLLVMPAVLQAETPEDTYWDESFTRHAPDQFADVMVPYEGELYVGGNFRHVGGVTVNYIARFDGKRWEALGSGVGRGNMGLVHTIAIDGDVLYVGGMFDEVGGRIICNIARYSISHGFWLPLGDGTNRAVRRIKVADNGDVYAVGEFNEADNQPANAVARFDGNRWYPLGRGLELVETSRAGDATVRSGRAMALSFSGPGVYVGGMFNRADGVPCSNVAYWNGNSFHPLGEGLNGIVTIMAMFDGQLYAGGQFSASGSLQLNSIARWDGTRWYRLGAGIGGAVLNIRALFADGSTIYVGGEFSVAGSQQANNVAVWNGTDWSTLGSGTNDEVKAITRFQDALFVGGNFTSAGGKSIPYLTRWAKDVVEVASFAADGVDGGIRLSWDTRAWAPVTGYHVYRSRGVGTQLEMYKNIADPSATSWMDTSVDGGAMYTYRLAAVRDDGREVFSEMSSAAMPIPSVALEQNYPNPFNPATTIAYSVAETAPVRLTIHDARGALVRTLVDRTIAVGNRTVEWDGRSDAGTRVGTGIYFYRLESAGTVLTRKMVLIK